jgi:hypothetical protein
VADNEVKIIIRAVQQGFKEVNNELLRWRKSIQIAAGYFAEEQKAAQASSRAIQENALHRRALAKALNEQAAALKQLRGEGGDSQQAGFDSALKNIQESSGQIDEQSKDIVNTWLNGSVAVNQIAAAHERLNGILSEQQRLSSGLAGGGQRIESAQPFADLSKQTIRYTESLRDAMQVRRGFIGTTLAGVAQLEGLSFQEATHRIKELREGLQDLSRDFVIAAGVITAFVAVLKKGIDFGTQGAQMERLAQAGNLLAKSYGVNLTEAVSKVKAASLDTISTQQAILSTNRALLLGVSRDADQLAKLMEVAALRGRATGLDTAEAFDRITLGIGRLSTRILDDIGIVIDGETAYANYGAAIGKTADELTEAEKRIALTNAIIEDGNKLIAGMGGVSLDSAAKIAQLATNVEDLGNKFKTGLAKPLADIATSINFMVFGAESLTEAWTRQNAELLATSETYEEYKQKLEQTIRGGIPDEIERINNQILKLKELSPIFGFAIDFVLNKLLQFPRSNNEFNALVDSMRALSEEQFKSAKAAEAHAAGLAQAASIAETVKARIQEMKEKIAESAEAMMDFTGTVDDMEIGDFIEQIISQMEVLGTTSQTEIDRIRLSFGLADQAALDFRDAVVAAGADGVIAMNELSGAIQNVIISKLSSLSKKFNADLANLGGGGSGGLKDLQGDLIRKMADIERDLARKLEDISRNMGEALGDLAIDISNKREDIARDHARKVEKIEIDHQRNLERIRTRFELSRLRALIDLDARALFEAEVQRDADLADAQQSAQDKRDEEARDHAERLADLARFEAQRQADIARDAARRAEDARRDAEERRADAQRDHERRLADQRSAGNNRRKELEDQFKKESKALLDLLARMRKREQEIDGKGHTDRKDDDDRAKRDLKNAQRSHNDTIEGWQRTHEATKTTIVNDGMRLMNSAIAGWLSTILNTTTPNFFRDQLIILQDFVDDWNRIIRGMRAPTPPPTGGGGGERPRDGEREPDTSAFSTRGVDQFSSSTNTSTQVVTQSTISQPQTMSVVVTLDVKGDGELAQMVRQSVVNVMYDVMAA